MPMSVVLVKWRKTTLFTR